MIILNGGSSSGKTSIARELQEHLREPWLSISIDDFVVSLPRSLQLSPDGFSVSTAGAVELGSQFTRLEEAWMRGITATANAGAPVIVDDVFLGGARSQQRWREALTTAVQATWVGVRCDPSIAQQREATRSDRDVGMAAHQAHLVHEGVEYDLQVDTSATSAEDCARAVVRFLDARAAHR